MPAAPSSIKCFGEERESWLVGLQMLFHSGLSQVDLNLEVGLLDGLSVWLTI